MSKTARWAAEAERLEPARAVLLAAAPGMLALQAAVLPREPVQVLELAQAVACRLAAALVGSQLARA